MAYSRSAVESIKIRLTQNRLLNKNSLSPILIRTEKNHPKLHCDTKVGILWRLMTCRLIIVLWRIFKPLCLFYVWILPGDSEYICKKNILNNNYAFRTSEKFKLMESRRTYIEFIIKY